MNATIIPIALGIVALVIGIYYLYTLYLDFSTPNPSPAIEPLPTPSDEPNPAPNPSDEPNPSPNPSEPNPAPNPIECPECYLMTFNIDHIVEVSIELNKKSGEELVWEGDLGGTATMRQDLEFDGVGRRWIFEVDEQGETAVNASSISESSCPPLGFWQSELGEGFIFEFQVC